jgi:hypothetical protein
MFILSRTLPPKGTAVRFQISLDLENAPAAIRVEGSGRVVRVERNPRRPGMAGFALVNQRFKIQEP